MPERIKLRSLILAGGQSSRMGSPKYLLQFPRTSDTIPLILQTILLHHEFYRRRQERQPITISVRDKEQQREVENALQKHPDDQLLWLKYTFDTIPHQGPATGLLAAHALDEGTHWMVTGCDYPLLETEALLQLASEHDKTRNAITCFRNSDGWTEPLLAIWSPCALERLREMSLSQSHIGPNRIIKAFADDESDAGSESTFSRGVCTVQPLKGSWTRSVNTKEDWEEVRKMIHEKMGNSGQLLTQVRTLAWPP
ncbi:hypothetical protein PV05_02174 [Exophiala xenobiotica]|uniref:MobA-like NTP transferase domain-containing protein n=1 Tax=Exophiala xenobiotica TaxID=348802 RepID=A0A0D2DIH3_9EURO|nr:uncharacterized protein PV05_02174 [Exophiala xenobiotica]KIW62127.1 hypothetical protein PV05_02174 [Exophiala xenobiotica]